MEKYRITENLELKEEILSHLKKNKEEYGERYCPCVPSYLFSNETICPCKNFREEVPSGEACHCGLFIKGEK